MRQELLLEIGTEEIPAGYIDPALSFMKKEMTRKLSELSLSFGEMKTAATPRRLVLCVSELMEKQPDRMEKILGPPKKAAFDADNKPTKAALGFASSRGATIDQLQIETTPKGEYLMLVQELKGRPTIELLSDYIPEFIQAIPFPKSMRWGTNRSTFARPLQWLTTLFGGEIIPATYNDLKAGNVTRGHRFMAPEEAEVTDFNQYLETLQQHEIIVDIEQRRKMVEDEINTAAASVNGTIVPDPELLDTVTNLVELPIGVCGSFDQKFLELPREVLITSMRVHQKYFTIADSAGNLQANFVAVNNTRIVDKNLAAAGHERVLRARLEDALFFFKEDKQHRLEERREALSGVIFQAKLGTMFEKTERVEKLAAFLAKQVDETLIDTAKHAARLAKADLVTNMVGEFPSLQGVMGKHYALADGEDPAVATAIEEHYLPLRAGSTLPETLTGALVSLAERLDTIAGCFGIGQKPTGTTDPYGLRRHTLALLHIIAGHSLRLPLSACIDEALHLYGDKLTQGNEETRQTIFDFIQGRYLNDLTSKGIPAEAVEAVTSVSFNDIVDCRMRIDALQAISSRETFTLLAGSFKRVNNIIKDHQQDTVDQKLLQEPAEKSLFTCYQEVAGKVEPLVEAQQYGNALLEILEMKEPIDSFFDDVMVMAEDLKIRKNRLSLLTAIAHLFLLVGDFSKMHGTD
jgi:glycyl-tRNA synthetase beta chain